MKTRSTVWPGLSSSRKPSNLNQFTHIISPLLHLLGLIFRELFHDLQHPLDSAHSLLLSPIVVLVLVLQIGLFLLRLVLSQVGRYLFVLLVVHGDGSEHVLLALVGPGVMG